VSDNALLVIQKDYVFAELVKPVYVMHGEYVNVVVRVRYLDQEAKTVQALQYDLRVRKEGNWKIID
jgi:hypothetical protein